MNIMELTSKLYMTHTRENWQQLCDEAKKNKLTHAAFLENVLECEVRQKMANSLERRIKEARFPLKKYLVDFDRGKYDDCFTQKFIELETVDFVGSKENIILIGTPGAGKTHYAIALGIAACMRGYSVLFASVPNLVVEIKEAIANNHMSAFRKRFERFNLIILDQLGYVSFDKQGCEILFNLISSRHDKGSTIVTTNLTFDRWEEIFKDPTLTGALIDRLAHKAHVMDISRDKGGRFEETLAWLGRADKEPLPVKAVTRKRKTSSK